MGTYVTIADAEGRISSRVLVAIFNDEGDGSLSAAEEDVVEDFISDAESEVEQVVQATYGPGGLAWLQALGTNAPRAVKRLVLDIFEVRAYRRHPEYVRAEWLEREKCVERSLKELRLRDVQLPHASEPEAQNEGGVVLSGDPDDTDPRPHVFLDGTGDF